MRAPVFALLATLALLAPRSAAWAQALPHVVAGASPAVPAPLADPAADAAKAKAEKGDPSALIKLADGGNHTAQVYLSAAYMQGAGGLKRDGAKACGYMEKASATRGDAAHFTGECYQRGLGGHVDAAKAKAAYEKAIALGYSRSKCALGGMLITEGVEGARGVELCRGAAETGDALAQAQLGYAYRNGKGVPADPKVARGWYERAAAQKQASASRVLGEMYLKGEGGKKDKKKASELWITAEKAGDPMAPILVADFMFGELTGGKTPGPGKFKIRAGAPLSQVDDVAAWYDAAAKRDPRPEVRARAQSAASVVRQIRVGLQNAGHPN